MTHLTPFQYVVPNWSPTKIHVEIRIATLDRHETVLLNFGVHHFIQNVGGFSLCLFQVSRPHDINPINLPYLGIQEKSSEQPTKSEVLTSTFLMCSMEKNYPSKVYKPENFQLILLVQVLLYVFIPKQYCKFNYYSVWKHEYTNTEHTTVCSESHFALIRGVRSLEVMSTSVYTGLNPFNFIHKHFLHICLWDVSYVHSYCNF